MWAVHDARMWYNISRPLVNVQTNDAISQERRIYIDDSFVDLVIKPNTHLVYNYNLYKY